MVKKLDKLILRAFIGPFLATFLLAIFVLVLQFFWLWIDDFVGKGLDMFTLIKVVMYVAASWVPVALPLAILLSTIMTFGNLGESYELVAIKSAGISLQRFMRPVLVVSILISGIAFLFNNNVIPVINLKLNKLKYEVVYTKPAFDIKPGIFYDKIEGYVIKLSQKEESGKIKGIIIYEKGNYLQDNMILADSGSMKVTEDKRFLEFNLLNGTRYEEKGMRNSMQTELTRLSFSSYKKVFDITSFFRVKTSDSLFKDNYRMLSVRQLSSSMDSIRKKTANLQKAISQQITPYFPFTQRFDSGKLKDLNVKAGNAKSLAAILPDSAEQSAIDLALSRISGARSSIDLMNSEYNEQLRAERLHALARQQKYAISFACFVLFLIGAPLGSIIRKGGLGTPLVFAVIFFVIFHLFNTVGEKMGKEGVLIVFTGAWLPSIVLLPVGFFLTYKAMRDSQLFNKEFYYRTFKRFQKMYIVWRNRKKVTQTETI